MTRSEVIGGRARPVHEQRPVGVEHWTVSASCHRRRAYATATDCDVAPRGTIRFMPDAVSTRPLLDKLGVKPGSRVVIAGVDDATFLRLLADRTEDVTVLDAGETLPAGTDLVFLAADSVEDLARIGTLRPSIVPDGAIWIVSRKGRAATIRDVDVIQASISFDMVDNKVVAFSETHTALRAVIPRALRRR